MRAASPPRGACIGRKELSNGITDLDLAVAELQRVREAAASSTTAGQTCFADSLRLRAGTAKALAAEIESLLS